MRDWLGRLILWFADGAHGQCREIARPLTSSLSARAKSRRLLDGQNMDANGGDVLVNGRDGRGWGSRIKLMRARIKPMYGYSAQRRQATLVSGDAVVLPAHRTKDGPLAHCSRDFNRR